MSLLGCPCVFPHEKIDRNDGRMNQQIVTSDSDCMMRNMRATGCRHSVCRQFDAGKLLRAVVVACVVTISASENSKQATSAARPETITLAAGQCAGLKLGSAAPERASYIVDVAVLNTTVRRAVYTARLCHTHLRAHSACP